MPNPHASTLLSTALSLLASLSASAWGPHAEITEAALKTLGSDHPLAQHLGAQTLQLTNYCWLPDFKRLPFKGKSQDFYANDYLLFPEVTTHWDHICPEVTNTYAPYFKRAVQALQTESPANAARWIGALLHFTQDTGSPPHAARIRGTIHIKMENWIDPNLIRLPGYQPRLLGSGQAAAQEGLLQRMHDLIDFVKPIGTRLVTPVMIGQRKTVEPLALQCALECARATADILHTLGQFTPSNQPGTASLAGTITSQAPLGFARIPARLVIHGSNHATSADPNGHFSFRNLPPATYNLTVFRPGNESTNLAVTLTPDTTTHLTLTLPHTSPNLIRNGHLQLSWIQAGQPDCWHKTRDGWEGEVIPLEDNQTYQIQVRFKNPGHGRVKARWTRRLQYALPYTLPRPRISTHVLTPEENTISFTGSPEKGLFQVVLEDAHGSPQTLYDSIILTADPK